MFTSKSVLLSMIISALLLLSACGGDEAETAAAATESAAAPADSMGSSMEKAEGVIYQDEIYANWPYN